MGTDRRVVVVVSPKVLVNSTTGTFAARIPELGLTAYGKTHNDAWETAQRMFASAVHAHRELGTLEDWLNRSGLVWAWEDQYKGPLPIQSTDPPQTTKSNGGEWLDMAEPLPATTWSVAA